MPGSRDVGGFVQMGEGFEEEIVSLDKNLKINKM